MRIRVEGGHPLNGDYYPSGNGNAAIYMIAASLLSEDKTTLRNFPDTTATNAMLEIAISLGAEVSRDNGQVTIQTKQINRRKITEADMGNFFGALLYLAPILVRRQYVRVEPDVPLSRIRTHLEAMRELGLDVISNDGAVECWATTWEYKDIILAQTSVTATAIVMMLAAYFGKETVVHNAASEPHLQELAGFLEAMGAQVQGVGSNVVRIFNAHDIHGADFTIRPDHIEVASVAAIGALTGGRIHINGIRRSDLRIIEKVYGRLGINFDTDETDLYIPKHETITASNRGEDVDSSIDTAPWPGFPSDLIAMVTVIASQARGTTLIHEKLYQNRLVFVDKLKAMGAQIVLCDPHRAIVVGPTPLQAIYMDSPDVRTGLGMLTAALVAKGESVIDNAEVLRSNFDGVVGKLKQLGAQIEIEQ